MDELFVGKRTEWRPEGKGVEESFVGEINTSFCEVKPEHSHAFVSQQGFPRVTEGGVCMCYLWVRWQGRRTGEGKRVEKSFVGKSSLFCDEVKPAFGSHIKIEKGPVKEACG